MHVEIHFFSIDDDRSRYSINDLSRNDLLDLYDALATVPMSPDERLSQLRDTIQRYLLDH